MIRSPNLNVMIKALDKVSSKIARDFGEIENLQSNSFAASKFANACYSAVKERLINDLLEYRPDFNIRFLDGQLISNNPDARATFVIAPIDGLLNFARAIPTFSTVIAVEEIIDGKKEITAIAINNIANNEMCIAQKGAGAFLRNRRVRIASHKPLNHILCAITNKSLFKNAAINNDKYFFQLSNCSSIDLMNLAAGKLDLVIFPKHDSVMLNIATVLITEAGGFISEKDEALLVGNNKLI